MSASDDENERALKSATRVARVGRDKSITGPFVNPPVVHASTVLFENVAEMQGHRARYVYGRRGTPTTEALESAMTALEGGAGTVLCPSGLSAAAAALMSCLAAGDHLLVVDTVYGPVRYFADTVLKRMGVETTYFDPALGGDIAGLFTERTRAVYAEAPGSLTFEMLDLPAIGAVAHERGATVLFDNSWATPLHFQPLAHGADLAIVAGTKYIGGHSDVMLGTVAANAAAWPQLKETHGSFGTHVGPDDVYLGLRGLRTLAIRITRQAETAMTIATWLEARPEVARVLFPPLPADPGHALWKRDMTGASGLFGIILAGWSDADASRFIDGLKLFGIGASWGGYESLAILARPERVRSATPWRAEGPLIRIHVGLEDAEDLIADLDASFAAVAKAPASAG